MKYSAEEFSRAGDQYLGRSYEEMDCQALVERMMADVGYKRDLGGSNSWYRECLKNGWAGTPEDCLREFGSVPKGAHLFIREDVSASTPGKFRNDGVGDITHMGVKTGRGDGAIHSSRSKGCVCTSKFKDRTIPNGGWNRVGLLPKVFDYGNWNEEVRSMKGTVTAKSGSTVKLRQKPSTNCPIYRDIPVGTEMQVVDQQENWSKCISGGLTGWMKNEFIRLEGEEDLPIAPEPSVSEDPGQFDDPKPDPELEQALALLADVYEALKDLCDRILSVVGKGISDESLSVAVSAGCPGRHHPGPVLGDQQKTEYRGRKGRTGEAGDGSHRGGREGPPAGPAPAGVQALYR